MDYDDNDQRPKWDRPEIDDWDDWDDDDLPRAIVYGCSPNNHKCWPNQQCWPRQQCWPHQQCWPRR